MKLKDNPITPSNSDNLLEQSLRDSVRPSWEVPVEVRRWEYTVLNDSTENLLNVLNNGGQEGWELVCHMNREKGKSYLIFKRRFVDG